MILGIETATPVCSVGIADGDRVIAEISFDIKNLHDRVLADAVQQMLRWSGGSLAQIDAIAVSAGPGSFTGLRIGMGVAKGLAFAQNKPVVAVNTLLLQAAAAARHAQTFAQGRGLEPSTVHIMPLLKSRRGEIYAAAYSAQIPLPAQIEAGKVITVADFPASFPSPVVLCGNGVALLQEAGILKSFEHVLVLAENEARLSGGLAARLGEIKFRRGEAIEAESLEPFYVQEFVVK